MKLVPDVACSLGRTYRTDLPPRLDRVAIAGDLADALGAVVLTRSPGTLTVLCERHEVLIVQKTGRVQLRIDLDTPRELRRSAAERLFVALVRSALRVAGPAR